MSEIQKNFKVRRVQMLDFAKREGIPAEDRQTGKSLGMIFGFISNALLHPNKEINVLDHILTKNCSINTFERLMRIVSELNLQEFTFNRKNLTIKFNLGEIR